MPQLDNLEAGTITRISATTTVCITSGPAALIGVAFVGTATGSIQFFAGVTVSASLTPMITFCATTSAVAGGFSPMFLRLPGVVSGNGFTIDPSGTNDPNLLLFWTPLARP